MGQSGDPTGPDRSMSTEQRPRPEWRFGAATAAAILLFLIFVFTPRPEEDHAPPPEWKAKTASTAYHPPESAPWLIATMSPASGIARRIVIRETWQRLYANASRFDMRFVLANATDPWPPYIEAENATHGDILTLPHLAELRSVANSIKPMEFFARLAGGALLRPYSFVSKIDDDSFLDATAFYDGHLEPILAAAADNQMHISPTLIGKRPRSGYGWDYPAGAFYTLTWDLVQAAVRVYNATGAQGIKDEDALIGKLLADSGVVFRFEEMPYREAFDYAAPEDKPWAREEDELDRYWHALGPGAVNVHNLKSNPVYLQVASCFDEGGLREDLWREAVDLSTWFKNSTMTATSSVSSTSSITSASSVSSASSITSASSVSSASSITSPSSVSSASARTTARGVQLSRSTASISRTASRSTKPAQTSSAPD